MSANETTKFEGQNSESVRAPLGQAPRWKRIWSSDRLITSDWRLLAPVKRPQWRGWLNVLQTGD
jgi:hypothetical protein